MFPSTQSRSKSLGVIDPPECSENSQEYEQGGEYDGDYGGEYSGEYNEYGGEELLQQKLMTFYSIHEPSKATPEHVDKLLSKYSISKILKKLQKKYGETIELGPDDGEMSLSMSTMELSGRSASNDVLSGSVGNLRILLHEFYLVHDPGKAIPENIEMLVSKYR
jgi:hypothetical protein